MAEHLNWAMRIRRNFQLSRTPIILPETSIAMGIISLIYGKHAASAFNTLANDMGVRLMGASMLIGGVLISLSYIRYDAFKETIGLVFAALGTAIYSTSVFIALGTQGLITGTGFLGLTLVFLSRIYFIILDYRSRKKISDAL